MYAKQVVICRKLRNVDIWLYDRFIALTPDSYVILFTSTDTVNHFLSIHADKKGMDISFTVCNFVCFLFVASKAGNLTFFELCSPRSPQSDESASARAPSTRM